MKTYIISVDYDEWNPETYRGVTVEVKKTSDGNFTEINRVKTQNPKKDFQNVLEKLKDVDEDNLIFTDSSVDHFSMDSDYILE